MGTCAPGKSPPRWIILALGVAAGLAADRLPRRARPVEPDTPERRAAAADVYARRVDADEFIAQAAEQLADREPPEQRAAVRRALQEQVRGEVIRAATRAALIRHFTAAEIRFLADFNGRPEGRAIQRKLGAYLADLLPPVQAELDRALARRHAGQGRLQWEMRQVDVRASIEDEELVVDFPFVNRGDAPVNIRSVGGDSCACLRGEADRVAYAPGETGRVRARFAFDGCIGRQSKFVLVRTDDPAEPEVRLDVDVDIPDVVRIEPSFSGWRVGDPPEPRTNRVRLLQPGIVVEGVECSNTLFQVEWRPAPDGGGAVRITPRATTLRAETRLDVRVRVSPRMVRRFPILLVIASEKLSSP